MAKRTQKDFVAVRLPKELVARIDKVVAQMAAEQPGIDFTRSAVMRVLLIEGLDAREKANGKA